MDKKRATYLASEIARINNRGDFGPRNQELRLTLGDVLASFRNRKDGSSYIVYRKPNGRYVRRFAEALEAWQQMPVPAGSR